MTQYTAECPASTRELWLDTETSQEPTTGSGFADETPWDAERRFAPEYQPTCEDIEEMNRHLQNAADPNAEVDAMAARVMSVCPGASLTISSNRTTSYEAGSPSRPQAELFVVTVRDGRGWVEFVTGETLGTTAARVIRAWASRPGESAAA